MSPSEAAPVFFLAVVAILVVVRLVCLSVIMNGLMSVPSEMLVDWVKVTR